MHPALSVLFFTVTSGMGFGLLVCLLIAHHFGAYPIILEPYSNSYWSWLNQAFLIDIAIATTLFTLGLLSSSLHLANPKNAWRSFTRFRSSWLSREAVFAVIIYPILAAYIAAQLFAVEWLVTIITVTLVLLLTVLVYCTAMIYASLKTIPQWHNRWVCFGFLIYSGVSGLMAYSALTPDAQLSYFIYLPALIAGMAVKLIYFHSLGEPQLSNINTATGFGNASQASISLFDTGHSSRNFSQREFIYTIGPKTTALARKVSLLFAFVLPALLTFMGLAWVALTSHYIGMLLERWLFFVEAKHVVRHYYAS